MNKLINEYAYFLFLIRIKEILMKIIEIDRKNVINESIDKFIDFLFVLNTLFYSLLRNVPEIRVVRI
jgi:hypothetical protein